MLFVFDRSQKYLFSFSLEKSHISVQEAFIDHTLNSSHTLEFVLHADTENAKKVEELYYVAVPHDNNIDYDLFLITEIITTHGDGKNIRFICDHAITELKDKIAESLVIDRKTAANALPQILTGTGWEVGTVETTGSHSLQKKYASKYEILQQFAETWGGVLTYRVTISGNEITQRLIDYKLEQNFSGKRFVYEKDLEEIERTIDALTVKTALYGYGKTLDEKDENDMEILLDFSSITWSKAAGDPADKPAGQTWIGDPEALAAYGRDGTHLEGYVKFDTDDPAELLQKTWDALQVAKIPKINYSVRVSDLYRLFGWGFEQIQIGRLAHIVDGDINIEAIGRIIKYKKDLLERDKSEVELGNILDKFTDSIKELENDIDTVKNNIKDIDTTKFVPADPAQNFSRVAEPIRRLQNALFSAGGSVVFSETEGILITDLPIDQSPTKAMRLKGGIFALGTWNTSLNAWDWRTFGTPDGFTADEITSGTMSFDRARGGTLTLGGANLGTVDGKPLFENGVLEVYNPTGEIIVTLTGEQGGFESLYIGELRGNNTITKHIQGDMTYYVDVVNGNDINDGLSTAKPLRTMQAAIDRLPRFIDNTIFIRVVNTSTTFVERLDIYGKMGYGSIAIALGRSNIMKGIIRVTGCQCAVYIATLQGSSPNLDDSTGRLAAGGTHAERAQIVSQAQGDCITANLFSYLNVQDVVVNGNNVAGSGVVSMYGSYTRCRYVESYNTTVSALQSGWGGDMDIINCVGKADRGVFGVENAHISGTGTAPSGALANTVTWSGAQITSTFTHNAGLAKPTYAGVTTTQWAANDTHSYNANTGWASDYIYQGQRPGDPPIWYGVIFFNTASFAALKNADGTNRPIQKVRLLLKRTNNTGENTGRKPTTYYNAQTSASGGIATLNAGNQSATTFLWGEEKWIDLPISYGQAFQSGSAKSIVLYIGSDQSHYMRFEAKATLEIVHG